MKKTFFIDSENVGDNWISLLDTVAKDDEILVFYTEKSPHMNYKNLVLLKESSKDVTFIECSEGNNALDFQLCTELGFQVHGSSDTEYVIVSNDTGYDAVIKYWKQRNIAIRRIKGATCSSKDKKTEEVSESKPQKSISVAAKSQSKGNTPSDEELRAMEILYVVGKDNLSDLHTALQQIFGAEKGKSYYNAFKTDSKYNTFLENHIKLGTADKLTHYCLAVFAQNGAGLSAPKGFAKYVIETWRSKKNLNSLRAALQSRYGNENYYTLIKAHVKILDNIK